MLKKMQQWLQTFPEWEGSLQLDDMDAVPGSNGLYSRGIQALSSREDVQGNRWTDFRWELLLRIAAAGEAAQRILNLQSWVMEQDRLGLAPKFGDDPQTEHIRAFDGQLQSQRQTGSTVYTLRLSAEFTKIYRGE